MSKSVLIRRTSLGKLIIRLWMAIVILLIPVSSYSLPYQSPRTQNVEQTNVPDYISQAEAGVKKYYPEYEEYFKEIIKIIRSKKYEAYILNDEIDVNITISWDLLENEKETIATLLISLEKVVWKRTFKSKIWISDNSDINDISNDITKWFKERYKKTIENLDNFEKEILTLTQKDNSHWKSSFWDEYITTSEKYMQLLKDLYIEFGQIRKSKYAQEWVKQYIETLQETGRTPSKIGQKYIDEYNKIIKK